MHTRDACTHRSRRLPINRRLRSFARSFAAACLAGVALAAPAAAQWNRVTALPASNVFTIRIVGDTIAAAVDSTVYVSVDAGTTWRHASKVAPGVPVDALWIRNGRVFAGTFGKGVFISDDLGTSWQPFNEGLVGGILNSQLDVSDLELSGDRLVAATLGAGVYVRSVVVADTWHTFGDVFEPNQASNVNDVAVGGTRLLACAGGNGMTFHRDPADADWTVDFLVNGTLRPGLGAQTALWIGNRWIVGTNAGVFLSPNGEQPFTPSVAANLRNLSWSTFVQHGTTTFAAFDSVSTILFADSHDGGTSWTIQERVTPSFAYQLAIHGNELYSAQSDGLWTQPVDPVASVDTGPVRSGLHFALAAQPVRDVARFRFELPIAAGAAIDLFDVTGRRAADRIAAFLSPGPHELTVDEQGLRPGVYSARLTAGAAQETVRLVRVP